MHLEAEFPASAQLVRLTVMGAELSVVVAQPEALRGWVHFIHGFNGSKEDSRFLMSEWVQRGYGVIAHDHRGIYQSNPAPNVGSLAILGQDVAEIHASLKLENVHLVGHSFGGLVAREAFMHQPETYGSLTLLCSGPAAPLDAMGWLAATAEFLEDRSTEVAYEELIAHPEIDINFSPNPDRSSLYARRWNASQSAAIRLHVDILLNERDRSAALAPWGSRIAVAYGEFDDAWPIAEQQEMAQACGARVIMIPNAGHCPNEDQPAYTSQALVSFWDEISQ